MNPKFNNFYNVIFSINKCHTPPSHNCKFMVKQYLNYKI